MNDATERTARDALSGPGAALRLAGPAIVASIAYMDPGNFATNIAAGARYGYALLWVVVAANLLAMLFQAMSAKIGIVTGRNLAELCRLHFPRPLAWLMWGVSEIGAMATDLAEFLGGAIGLALLFRMKLLAGMAVTGLLTYAILLLDRSGYRSVERVIGALVAVIAVCYVVELAVAPPDWAAIAYHSVVPGLPDRGALPIAVGIVGATVMPHAIYLHSGLTQNRAAAGSDAGRARLVRYSTIETVLALSVASLVNMAMLAMAARAFHAGHPGVATIETAYHTLVPLLGIGAAGVFLLSLMASGISSSVVGTMAGQVIMQGFLRRAVPVSVRRLVTMLPAFAVVALGYDATEALIVSQIVLSIVLPVPVLALVVLSRRAGVMGVHATGPALHVLAVCAAALILALNAALLSIAIWGA